VDGITFGGYPLYNIFLVDANHSPAKVEFLDISTGWHGKVFVTIFRADVDVDFNAAS
jgi:hypothetical protein